MIDDLNNDIFNLKKSVFKIILYTPCFCENICLFHNTFL